MYEKWKYYCLAEEIANNLDGAYTRIKEEYQNTLNNWTKQSIIDMMSKWFNGHYYNDVIALSEQIIKELEWKLNQKLY